MKTFPIVAFVFLLAGCSSNNGSPPDHAEKQRRAAGTALVAISEDPASPEGLFARKCGVCHAGGRLYPGTRALEIRGVKPAVLLDRTDLDKAYVEQVVRNGLGSMPPFTPTALSDSELVAITKLLSDKRK